MYIYIHICIYFFSMYITHMCILYYIISYYIILYYNCYIILYYIILYYIILYYILLHYIILYYIIYTHIIHISLYYFIFNMQMVIPLPSSVLFGDNSHFRVAEKARRLGDRNLSSGLQHAAAHFYSHVPLTPRCLVFWVQTCWIFDGIL